MLKTHEHPDGGLVIEQENGILNVMIPVDIDSDEMSSKLIAKSIAFNMEGHGDSLRLARENLRTKIFKFLLDLKEQDQLQEAFPTPWDNDVADFNHLSIILTEFKKRTADVLEFTVW